MDVWVVSTGTDYEGLDEPDSVWTSESAATERQRQLQSLPSSWAIQRPLHDYVEVTKLTLDVAPGD